MTHSSRPGGWEDVRLVIFDVDGTLYRQRPLRMRMLLELLLDAARTRRLETIRVLRQYRKLRERLGEEEVVNFDKRLILATAERTGSAPARVREIVTEWIDRRPLRHLPKCRYRDVDRLFHALRKRGIAIGILSDYPALDKVAALGLEADHIVWAGDERVGLLKPHPKGLETLLSDAGVARSDALLIGDRIDRDGEAARRAGVEVFIRSDQPVAGWTTFARYDDPLFASLENR